MNNVITLVAWHDSRVSVTHDPYVTHLFLHGSETRRTLTQVEKKK